jgi:hypothetical protein
MRARKTKDKVAAFLWVQFLWRSADENKQSVKKPIAAGCNKILYGERRNGQNVAKQKNFCKLI